MQHNIVTLETTIFRFYQEVLSLVTPDAVDQTVENMAMAKSIIRLFNPLEKICIYQ